MKLKIIIGLCVIWVTMGFFPVDRNSIPVTEIVGNSQVTSILRRACFNCHSTETNWPWYSYVFPVSVFIYNHVKEGREELDFSNWKEISHSKKLDLIDSMIEEIELKEMPPSSYLWMHKESILSEEDIEILRKWQKEMEEIKEEEDTYEE
jgi:hypothetical protein